VKQHAPARRLLRAGHFPTEVAMRVSEAMSRNVRLAAPGQTIRDAAKIMADIDAGAIPVQDNDRLVGMITDRDIAVRAVAAGKGPDTPVGDVMTRDIKYCYEDEELDHVAKNMGDIRVRRLPVVNREKRLVGIISLADLAVKQGARPAGKAVTGVSQPGGPHSHASA
jgi:CBS domain-containing protein